MSFNFFTEDKDNCDILFFNDLDVFLFSEDGAVKDLI